MKNEINKTLSVLGSTGSVGRQALEAADELGCKVNFLSGMSNADLMAEQVRKYMPEAAAMADSAAAERLRGLLAGQSVKIYGGVEDLLKCISEYSADIILHSVAGLAGLPAALAAAGTGKRLAIANKESIIAAGDMIYEKVNASGGELIPVDSEHSAIFQCLCAQGLASLSSPSNGQLISKIILTASGGPFLGKKRDDMDLVTPQQALAHPTWKMGKKITVDSATLMNKGFEIIEATRLFGVDEKKVEVVVHPQSIIHSMVEYIDNSIIAQLGLPDMKSAVRYAFSYPERTFSNSGKVNFAEIGKLTFLEPDTEAFPLLDTARYAVDQNGNIPTALIAADEEAVSAFLDERISFNAISDVVSESICKIRYNIVDSISDIFNAEEEARALTKEIITKMSK